MEKIPRIESGFCTNLLIMGFDEAFQHLETLDQLKAKLVFGPVHYHKSEEKDKVKLFKFCRESFPHLSIRTLRQCFLRGCVLRNDNFVDASHDSEAIRLQDNDSVSIELCWEMFVRESDQFQELKICHENERFAIIEKGAGTDTSRSSLFGVSYRLKLWDGNAFATARALYETPRSHSGLLIVARDASEAHTLFHRLSNSTLRIHFTAIVCCHEPFEQNHQTFLFSNDKSDEHYHSAAAAAGVDEPWSTTSSGPHFSDEFSSLDISVLRTASSRASDYLSLIEGGLSFRLNALSATQHPSNWITQALQTVCHHLSQVLHLPVVGHGQTMNSQHGVFLTWNKIVESIIDGDEEKIVHGSSCLPAKFHKFLDTEERMVAKAAASAKETEEQLRQQWNKQEQYLARLRQRYPRPQSSSSAATASAVAEDIWNVAHACVFGGLVYRVSSDVLVPRVSSETVIEAARQCLMATTSQRDGDDEAGGDTRPLHIVDLGTGSGNLLLSTMYQYLRQRLQSLSKTDGNSLLSFPSVRGIGLDVSPSALEIAAWNGEHLLPMLRELDDAVAVDFVIGDFSSARMIAQAVGHGLFQGQPIDVLLCNPPYSSLREQRLSESVKRRDPSIALFAHETDALWAYRQLAATLSDPQVTSHLVIQHTRLVFEIGHGQADSVRKIFRSSPWRYVDIYRDHKALQRAVVFLYIGTASS